MTDTQLKTLTADLLKPVLGFPEALTITIDRDGRFVGIVVRPAQQDLARLIGRGGENFRTVEAILHRVGQNAGLVIRYFVQEARVLQHGQPTQQPFDGERLRGIAKQVLAASGFDDAVLLLPRPGQRVELQVGAPLPYGFGEHLKRWIHNCAKTHGGVADLQFDSVTA